MGGLAQQGLGALAGRLLALALSYSFPCSLALSACGTDVDLGGSIDAGPLDASLLGVDCDPCTSASDCVTGSTCGVVSGDLYCAKLCTGPSECSGGDDCATLASPDGGTVKACVPSSGACPPQAPPSASDGAIVNQCDGQVGPTVTADCHACGSSSTECQANGCYGGYWCDTAAHDCEKPPKTCN